MFAYRNRTQSARVESTGLREDWRGIKTHLRMLIVASRLPPSITAAAQSDKPTTSGEHMCGDLLTSGSWPGGLATLSCTSACTCHTTAAGRKLIINEGGCMWLTCWLAGLLLTDWSICVVVVSGQELWFDRQQQQ